MGISNSYQITKYYDFFRDREIIFTKVNLQSLRIDPRQLYVKCNGSQWPCIINSSSLQNCKIIVGANSGAYKELVKENVSISVRYCFIDQDNNPVSFFVNCNIQDKKKYNNSEELALITLNFSQRPPDELIMRMGEFLETNENFKNRKEDRIVINKESCRKLNLEKEETIAYIEKVPRKCIIKDISFCGAKIMTIGIPKYLINKKIEINFDFLDYGEAISVPGKILNADFFPGRQDISVINVEYDVDLIPMKYKYKINDYITTIKKNALVG